MALHMDISFKKKKMKKVFEDEKALRKDYGDRMARAIMTRMAVLEAAANLAEVPVDKPERCHQLTENRDEQFAVDLVHPERLVFEVDHDPIPRVADGGISRQDVTAVMIIEVVDYH